MNVSWVPRLFLEATPVNWETGWNIIGYLRDNAGATNVMLSSIAGSISLLKDENGNAWVPPFPPVSLPNLTPGQGYQLEVDK